MKKQINRGITILVLMSLAVLSVQAEHHESKNKAEEPLSEKSLSPKTYINSSEKAYAAMEALPVDEPIDMLNMIRYKDKAVYEEGSEFADKGLTGAEAYAEYSRHASPIAKRVGGAVTYLGTPQLTIIGPEHEKWDAIFILSYPNLQSFLALVSDPEYKKHAFHRSAAVADSRLVRMAPSSEPVE